MPQHFPSQTTRAAAHHAPHHAPHLVRWRPSPCFDVKCELLTDAAAVARRAAALFCVDERNLDDSPSDNVWRWSVENADDIAAARWRVRDLDANLTSHFSHLHDAMTHIEYSIVQRLVEIVKADNAISSHQTPLFAIHGALLSKNGFGLMIVGASCSGKSTLSCALWQNGWDLRSDDFSFLRDERAFPAARRVSLREGSRALLGENLWKGIGDAPSSSPTGAGWLFHPHEVRPPSARHDFVRLQAIIFLGRPNREPSEETPSDNALGIALQRCNAARAAVSLLPYCTLLARPDDAPTDEPQHRVLDLDWGKSLSRIAPLASHVPIYDLRRGALPSMVAAVETLVAQTLVAETLVVSVENIL